MTHLPGPWPTMKERMSCGCCWNYSLKAPCQWYSYCKGYGSTSFWSYSPLVEKETAERDARRERDGLQRLSL